MPSDHVGPAQAQQEGEVPVLLTAPGRWLRRFPAEHGEIVVERGLVLDEAPIILLEWVDPKPRWEAPAPKPGPGPDTPAVRVALLGAGVDSRSARRLLDNPPARARIREARGTPYEDEAFVLKQGGGDVLGGPLSLLDGAALGAVPDAFDPTHPRPPGTLSPVILRGAPTVPSPEILEGANLAEYGLAVLMAGRRGVVRDILAGTVGRRGKPSSIVSPLPFLLLAARWCLWTGRSFSGSEPGKTALDIWAEVARTQARDEMGGGVGRAGAAFPSLPCVLEELADGLEGLGDPDRPGRFRDWAEELRDTQQSASPPQAASGNPSPTAGRGLRLPVLGDPAPKAGPTPNRGDRSAVGRPRVSLPPPAAFGSPSAPAILPRRTLHIARLVRSWMEGILGAEPDASAGRLAFSLDLRNLPTQGPIVEMQNLRVGDCRVALDCRGDRGVFTFRLLQQAGRVPLNLILQLHLPDSHVRRVRLGREIVDVEVKETAGGVLLRCQFPLDPERRMIVETGD